MRAKFQRSHPLGCARLTSDRLVGLEITTCALGPIGTLPPSSIVSVAAAAAIREAGRPCLLWPLHPVELVPSYAVRYAVRRVDVDLVPPASTPRGKVEPAACPRPRPFSLHPAWPVPKQPDLGAVIACRWGAGNEGVLLRIRKVDPAAAGRWDGGSTAWRERRVHLGRAPVLGAGPPRTTPGLGRRRAGAACALSASATVGLGLERASRDSNLCRTRGAPRASWPRSSSHPVRRGRFMPLFIGLRGPSHRPPARQPPSLREQGPGTSVDESFLVEDLRRRASTRARSAGPAPRTRRTSMRRTTKRIGDAPAVAAPGHCFGT